jgi:hypothetical protein
VETVFCPLCTKEPKAALPSLSDYLAGLGLREVRGFVLFFFFFGYLGFELKSWLARQVLYSPFLL